MAEDRSYRILIIVQSSIVAKYSGLRRFQNWTAICRTAILPKKPSRVSWTPKSGGLLQLWRKAGSSPKRYSICLSIAGSSR